MTAPTTPEAPADDAAAPAATEHKGGMIALVPAHPELLAVAGGDPAEELHLTLAYLGDDATLITEEAAQLLKGWAADISSYHEPLTGSIFAHSLWNPASEEFEPATVYEIDPDGWELAGIQDSAVCRARDILGSALFPKQHSPFKPHVTAGYNLDVSKLTATGEVTFDRIRIALGGEVTDFPLSGPSYGDGYDYPMGSYTAITAAGTTTVKEDGDPVPAPDLNADNGIPITFPVMIVEGLETSDGRFIEVGAIGHRALPLSILAQTKNPDGGVGHDGAEIIGRIDTLTRTPGPDVIDKETGKPFDEGVFIWSGTGFIDPDAHATGLVKKRYLTGNSADLAELKADFVFSEEGDELDQLRVTSAKIAATTLVAIPAFAQAYIQLDGKEITPAEDMPESIVASAMWRSADVGDDCLPCAAGVSVAPVTAAGTVTKMYPDISLFADPEFTEYTAPTVDGDHVFGHLAEWGSCHIGFVGQCVAPPKSVSDYAAFRTGIVLAQEGDEIRRVSVGHITLGTGHADTDLSARPAAEHYDNTGTVVADVTAGEDAHGIWFSGRLRPGLSAERIAELTASPLSGDWRGVNGNLELVAALAVNVPGFLPKPRARVASGAPMTLIASGAKSWNVAVTQGGNTAGGTMIDMGKLATFVADEIEARTARNAALRARAYAAKAKIARGFVM